MDPDRIPLYWAGMTQKVGAKGQVVIPKELREHAGIHPGTGVDFSLDGDRLVLTVRRSGSRLAGRFNHSGMAEDLLRDRAREPR